MTKTETESESGTAGRVASDKPAGANLFFYWDIPENFPPRLQANVDRAAELHPGWTVRLIDDAAAQAEILRHRPDVLEIYREARIPACKSDIARLVLCAAYGGWYLDADLGLIRSLDHLPLDRPVLFSRDDFVRQGKALPGVDLWVTNMALHLPQGHPVATRALDAIVDRYRQGKDLFNVFRFSGPRVLSAACQGTPESELCLLSFEESFRGEDKLFHMRGSASTGSWRVVQGFGIFPGLKPHIRTFPKTITLHAARNLANFVRATDSQEALATVIEHRPQYAELDPIRELLPAEATADSPAAPAVSGGAEPRETPDTKTTLCVHGIFRSGTNFMRSLMESNFDCRVEYDSYGWKHAPYPILARTSRVRYPKIPSIFITKNPVYAMSSLLKYAQGNKRNIRSAADAGGTAFLDAPIVVFNGADAGSPELLFDTPVAFWNTMVWNYLSVVEKREDALHVRYEEIVRQPREEATRIASGFGLAALPSEFTVPEKRLKKLGMNAKNPDIYESAVPFEKSSTEFATYAAVFTSEDLARIADLANDEVVARSGYSAFMAAVAEGRPEV